MIDLRGAIAPTLTAYALVVAIVVNAARHPVERAKRRPRRLDGSLARRLVGELALLALAGYATFVAIVVVFGAVVLRDTSLVPSAVGGGAVLVAIALPVFVAASWLEGRRGGSSRP
jgi:hypothetical protein